MDYNLQYDKIYRYCYYKVKDRDIAEDLTQETFLRLLHSGYREQGKMLPYLYTIARNLCIDYYRGKDFEITTNLADAPGIEATLDMEKEITVRSDVRRALALLSEEDREILLLKYVNEEKDEVICKIFGISRFSLYRRIRRLRRSLQEQLFDYMP